jgi:cytochrome c
LPLFGQDQHSSKHFISTDHQLFWGLTSTKYPISGNAERCMPFNLPCRFQLVEKSIVLFLSSIHGKIDVTHMLKRNRSLLIGCLLFSIFYLQGCYNKPEQKNTKKATDYIKQISGINDSIPAELAEKGKVLISYSDCYICHKEDERSVGPAFKDIAKRYPANNIYIEILAQKVIVGGNRSWGYPIMDPHPKLSLEDAKKMVTYILSMKM